MISLLAGLILTVASIAIFVMLRPRNGEPHRLATAPFMQTMIPVTITSGLVLGVAFLVSGLFALIPH